MAWRKGTKKSNTGTGTGSSTSGSTTSSSSSTSGTSSSSGSTSSSSGSSAGSSSPRGNRNTSNKSTPSSTKTPTTNSNPNVSTQKVMGSVVSTVGNVIQTPDSNQPKGLWGSGITVDFGSPTNVTSPYAQTQFNRGQAANSQSPVAVAKNESTNAQPASITYATTKSGNTFIIPSNLSADARQYYAKLGVATSSQKPTDASWATDADTDVIVDNLLANQEVYYYDLSQQESELVTQEDAQPVQTNEDAFTDNMIPKGDNAVANGVQFSANNLDANANAAAADKNWNLGQNLYTGTAQNSLDILDQATKQETGTQWMTQINDNIVPRATAVNYAADAQTQMDAGVANLKDSIGRAMQNKYFPLMVIGLAVIIVLMFLRPKGAGAAAAAPAKAAASKVIQIA